MKLNGKCQYLEDPGIEIDSQARAAVERITELPMVKHTVIVPDFHFKKKMEAPSSIAVSTQETIVPHFTSSSLNCGMGLLNTGIPRQEFTDKYVRRFYDLFRNTHRDAHKYDLNQDSLRHVLVSGAESVCKKHSLPPTWLERIEQNGNLNRDGTLREHDIGDIMDRNDLSRADYIGLKNLGLGFSGNHFVELQYVSEIKHATLCQQHHIAPGDVMLMYHGGGGIVPGFIGGYFANRQLGYTNDIRLFYNKARFHFPTIAGIRRGRERWRYYFSKEKYVAIPDFTDEGTRVKKAQIASMNYGYAYRMIAVARMVDALRKAFSDSMRQVALLHDSSHNHILNEKLNGQSYWMHRHNSCHVTKDALRIFPGFHTTSSYVGVGLANTGRYMNTMPHGAGHTIKRYWSAGLAEPIPDRKTHKFLGESGEPVAVDHMTDEGIDSVVRILEENQVFAPIAKLTPFAVLKDFHK